MDLVFEWDEEKNKKNILKHGIDFREAATVFEDPDKEIFLDNRKDYKETKKIIVGKATISNTILILTVVITERGEIIRIISARKTNKEDTKQYYYGYNS